MDIALLSMYLHQGKAQQNVSVALMKKAMNTSEQQSQGLTQMLEQTKVVEQAVHPHLGGSIDLKL